MSLTFRVRSNIMGSSLREGGVTKKDHKRSYWGKGGSPKDHRGSQLQGGGEGAWKKLAKLKVLKKEMIYHRISYQWVV